MRPRALLLEDNPEIAELLALFLEDDLGLAMDWHQTPQQAMRALQSMPPPRVALLDYWIAGGGGIQVAVAAANLGIPLAFVTGDIPVADLLAHEGVPVLKKPFRPAELVSLVSGLLRGRQGVKLALHRFASSLGAKPPGRFGAGMFLAMESES